MRHHKVPTDPRAPCTPMFLFCFGFLLFSALLSTRVAQWSLYPLRTDESPLITFLRRSALSSDYYDDNAMLSRCTNSAPFAADRVPSFTALLISLMALLMCAFAAA